jgi:mannose-6-phosphate isomerase class I
MRGAMVQVFGATMSFAVPPFLLRSDNFTSDQRTPWGGTYLAHQIKRHVLGPEHQGRRIGESWELSTTRDLPSVDLQGEPLRDRIRRQPADLLGAEARHGSTNTSLMVKLLDAADDLSVQIHPGDDDPKLGPSEAGKTEAWLVVHAEPDAAIYLGLKDHVDERAMRAMLTSGGDLSALLRRWPVQAGDFFVVEPGTPHAIGRGVVVVEPHTAKDGREPVTYRYWDWNRRYDAQGRVDQAGVARPLHVERALEVTRWPEGDATTPLVSRAGAPEVNAAARWEPLCGPDAAACHSSSLRVGRFIGCGAAAVPDWNVLRALTVLEGSVTLHWPTDALTVTAGQTAVVPACAMHLTAQMDSAHAVLSAPVP